MNCLKKITLISILIIFSLFISYSPAQAATKTTATKPKTTTVKPWQPTVPQDYTPIDWVKARGVATFMKAPSNNGYTDFLTYIYLPYNEVRLVTTNTPKVEFGSAVAPFDTNEDARNWAFTKTVVEQTKQSNPDMKFLWNAPFFNITIPVTDLSMALKSTDATSTYITSGSRPANDINIPRKMLIINNTSNTAQISDFDEQIFMSTSSGQEAVEGFSATATYKGDDCDTARLFIGVKPNNKELVIYCSRGASPSEANAALINAGVPLENQIQVDGGVSATCAYNLPGQYLVEPGRTLPHVMGAFPFLYKATVTTEGLKVRSLPNAKGKIITKLTNKTIVKIFEEKNGWARIDQEQHWVSASYLKKIMQ